MAKNSSPVTQESNAEALDSTPEAGLASPVTTTNNKVAQNSLVVNSQYMQNGLGNTENVDTRILKLEQTALDRSFLSMDESTRADFVQRFEKATGTRVVFDETLDAGGKYENKVITVNPNTDTPMTVIIHELTHHIEQTGDYRDFRDFVLFKSQIFKEWMHSKGFRNIAEFAEAVIQARAQTKHPLGQNGADANLETREEILANFVGEKLIRDARALEELLKGKPRWFEKIRNWFANLIRHFRSTPMERELLKMEQMFAKAVQERRTDNGNRDNAESKYLITGDESKADISKLTEENVRELLRNAADGIYYDNSYIPLRRNTPAVLIKAAQSMGDVVENLPVIMSVKKVRQAMETGDFEEGGDRAHNLSEDDMISIVKAMDQPDYIVFQSSNERFLEIVRYRTGGGGLAIAVIEIGEDRNAPQLNGYKAGRYQILVTAYPPDSYKEVREILQNKKIEFSLAKKG